MSQQNELNQLEEERIRLQSMVDHHNPPRLVPLWVWACVLLAGFAILLGRVLISGLMAGEYTLSSVAAWSAILGLLAYLVTRPITFWGVETTFFEVVLGLLSGFPSGRPAGEPQIRQRLADCETRIKKLKERHS
jgi:hypothetical protein